MTLHEHIGPSPQTAAGFKAEVFALAADTHIELKTLIGQPALIELELADASLRSWHGHITDVALVGSDGGLARYRIVIEPWLAFLAHRQDSWVFQNQSVIDIIEALFADYSGQGKLTPAWRFELADAAVYPKRSLCIQYQESDLAFVQRLLLEEGLFCWWEHEAREGYTLGTHTLVIADHNGAIAPCSQPRVRFTQSAASLTEDSLTRWRTQAVVHSARLEQASPDYRSNGAAVALRAQSQSAINARALTHLAVTDIPGLYAYEDSAQGQRLALRQMQALDSRRHRATASGTLRAAAPATRITLAEHPRHALGNADDEFIILGAQHRARSNLRADHKAQVKPLRALMPLYDEEIHFVTRRLAAQRRAREPRHAHQRRPHRQRHGADGHDAVPQDVRRRACRAQRLASVERRGAAEADHESAARDGRLPRRRRAADARALRALAVQQLREVAGRRPPEVAERAARAAAAEPQLAPPRAGRA